MNRGESSPSQMVPLIVPVDREAIVLRALEQCREENPSLCTDRLTRVIVSFDLSSAYKDMSKHAYAPLRGWGGQVPKQLAFALHLRDESVLLCYGQITALLTSQIDEEQKAAYGILNFELKKLHEMQMRGLLHSSVFAQPGPLRSLDAELDWLCQVMLVEYLSRMELAQIYPSLSEIDYRELTIIYQQAHQDLRRILKRYATDGRLDLFVRKAGALGEYWCRYAAGVLAALACNNKALDLEAPIVYSLFQRGCLAPEWRAWAESLAALSTASSIETTGGQFIASLRASLENALNSVGAAVVRIAGRPSLLALHE